MKNRRQFLQTSMVAAAGLAVAATAPTIASAETGPFPTNVVYTESDQGIWQGKAGSHAPKVSMADGKITLETKHGMSPKHYIVRHTLVSADGKVVGAKVFMPKDKAVSMYDLPAKGTYYATSFCNLHDFWVTKITI